MPSSEWDVMGLYYFRCAVTPAAPYVLRHINSCCYWLIPATVTSSAVATSTSRPVLPSASFCLFAVLQNGLVFQSKLRRKTVLCRSADKSVPLVTHWPTNALLLPETTTVVCLVAHLQAPNQWILLTVKILSSRPSVTFIRFYLRVLGCTLFNHE